MSAALSLMMMVLAAGEHPRLEQDACATQRTSCERTCDVQKDGMDRLNCKTDCRIAESECRSGKRR